MRAVVIIPRSPTSTMFQGESVLHGSEGGRVGGVPGEHPDRDGAAGGIGEYCVFDLREPLLLVAGERGSAHPGRRNGSWPWFSGISHASDPTTPAHRPSVPAGDDPSIHHLASDHRHHQCPPPDLSRRGQVRGTASGAGDRHGPGGC